MLAKRLALLLTLALLLSAGLVQSAAADGGPGADPSAAFAPPDLEEDECAVGDPECEEAFLDEECEALDEEEECEEVLDEAEGEAPAECLLITARPRVSIGQGKLRLDVRYTLTDPASVTLSLRASGAKGSLAIAPSRHRLSRDGTLHESAELSDGETERALAAREFTVRLRVAGVPSSCHRYDVRHLAVKRGGASSAVFSESQADLRAGR